MSRLDDFRIKAKAEGYDDNEINSFIQERNQAALNEGYSMDEINDHWGIGKPDYEREKALVKSHVVAEPAKEGEVEKLPSSIESFDDVYKLISSGLAHSAVGMTIFGKPMKELPQDPTMAAKIIYSLSEVVPDLPVMGAGGFMGGLIGGAAGTAIAPGPGTAAGITAGYGAGAFALPTAWKEYLVDGYENGSFKNFGDFWARMSHVMIETGKSAVTGVATEFTAGLVNPVTSKLTSVAAQKAATELAKVGVMNTVGSAVNGQFPTAEGFIESGAVVGALSLVSPVKSKLTKLYVEKNVLPEQAALDSTKSITVKQDLLSANKEVPDAYDTKPVDKELSSKLGKPLEPMFTEEEIRSQPPEVKIGKELEAEKAKEEIAPIEIKPVAEGTSYEESLNAISSQLVTKGGEGLAGKAEAVKSYLTESMDNLYTNLVDYLHPVHKAVKDLQGGKSVKETVDSYMLSRLANDANAKALITFVDGTFDYNTLARNGKSLNEAMSLVKKSETREFDAFLAANRAIELHARGIEDTGFPIDHARNFVNKAPAHFKEAAKEVTAYRNRMLDYVVQAGFISAEQAQSFKDANQMYVPFKRIIDVNNEAALQNRKGKKPSFKELKGANELKTQSPLQVITQDAAQFFRLAEANRARVEMVKMQEATPGEHRQLIRKVKTPGKVELSQLAADILNAAGIPTEQGEAFKFTMRNTDLKDNQFEIYRNGKSEVWEANDARLAHALRAIDGEPGMQNLVFKLASAVTSSVRFTTSVTPDFIMKNFFVDQIAAQALSKGEGFHALQTLKSVGDLMGKEHSEAWAYWMKSGGAGGAFIDINKRYFDKEIYKLQGETGFLDATWNAITTPFKAIESASMLLEQSTRLAEFKKTTKGDYSVSSVFQGGFNAREVTVDFQRRGAATSVLNSITAFQNAGIQGLDKTVRAGIENKGKIASMAGLFITAPTLLNYAVNKDDPRYRDAPNYQRDLYWVVPTDNWVKPGPNDNISKLPDYLKRIGKDGMPEINTGVTLRIPKPRELGLLFGSSFERALDGFFAKNPEAFKGFSESILSTISPSFMPDIVRPISETWANKNAFTGNPLVPHWAEKLLPRDRYTEYTSEVAKKASALLSHIPALEHSSLVSPAVIDNWIRDWTGNMGRTALSVIDWGVKENTPEMKLEDIPFVKSFLVRNPSMGAQPIQDFQEKSKDIKQYVASINKLGKSQVPEDRIRAQELQQTLLKRHPDYQRVLNASSAMQNMRGFIHNVYRTDKMTKHEKRQAIDGVYYQMIEMARGTKKAALQGAEESEE